MSVQVPTVTLNNGVEMPILGFGVFQIPAASVMDRWVMKWPGAAPCQCHWSAGV